MEPTAQDLQRWKSYKRQDLAFNTSAILSTVLLILAVFCMLAK